MSMKPTKPMKNRDIICFFQDKIYEWCLMNNGTESNTNVDISIDFLISYLYDLTEIDSDDKVIILDKISSYFKSEEKNSNKKHEIKKIIELIDYQIMAIKVNEGW